MSERVMTFFLFYIIYIFSKIKDKMKMVSGLNKKSQHTKTLAFVI